MTKVTMWRVVWAVYLGALAGVVVLVPSVPPGLVSAHAVVAIVLAVLALGCHMALIHRVWHLEEHRRGWWHALQKGFWFTLCSAFGVTVAMIAHKLYFTLFAH